MSNLKERVQDLERELILEALRQTGWSKTKAARSLGTTDRILDYKMKKYGIHKMYSAEDKSENEDPESRTGTVD